MAGASREFRPGDLIRVRLGKYRGEEHRVLKVAQAHQFGGDPGILWLWLEGFGDPMDADFVEKVE